MRLINTICIKSYTIKTAFILGMIFWSYTGFSQEKNFQLIGRVDGLDTGLIKLVSLLPDSANKSSFTCNISKGRFMLQGKIPHPMRVYLVLNSSLYTEDFFIEPGSQNIYFDATNNDSFYSSMKITGSRLNDEFLNDYQKPLKPFYDSIDSCYLILDSLNKLSIEEKRPTIITELCDQINLNNRKTDSVKRAYFIEHSSSFVSLWAMYTNIWFLENLDFVTECFKYLDKQLQNSKAGQKLAKRIEGQMKFLNGQIFPDMLIADSVEKKVTIQENIKGKYTLIDFWFSHCGPCIVQFPLIRNLYTKYKDTGFDVIGISVDKSADKKNWLEAIEKYKLNWKQYWDIEGKEANKFFIDKTKYKSFI